MGPHGDERPRDERPSDGPQSMEERHVTRPTPAHLVLADGTTFEEFFDSRASLIAA